MLFLQGVSQQLSSEFAHMYKTRGGVFKMQKPTNPLEGNNE